MNKNELIASAANRCGRSQRIVRECLDALLCIVSEELTKGGEVKILEFGRLYGKERKAQTVIVPCGKVVYVPPMRVVHFKAYSHFKHYSTKY